VLDVWQGARHHKKGRRLRRSFHIEKSTVDMTTGVSRQFSRSRENKKSKQGQRKTEKENNLEPPPIGQVLRRRCWRKNQISKKKKKKNPKMRRRANGTVRYWARVRGYIFKRRKIYTTTTTHRTRRRRRRRRKNDDRVYKI
jgi:hypothetical protein